MALAAGVLLVSAAPAAADTMHRGVDGCFSWSWKDGGFATTTVYYTNRCKQVHRIRITWDDPGGSETHTVGGRKSGSSYTMWGTKVVYVSDEGRA